MMTNANSQTETTPVKTIRLADQLDRLQDQMSKTRAYREIDDPQKERVLAGRRVKVGGW